METSSRRKACDTCFKKKIKCDMLKPTCSNCRLYHVPCSTTSVRSRRQPARDTPSATPKNDSLEARLERIEAKLDEARKNSITASANSGTDPELAELLMLGDQNDTHDPSSSIQANHISKGGLELPRLSDAIPIVQDYFANFNSIYPLFHQPTFIHTLNDFYSNQGSPCRITWAAINVVMAIGLIMRTFEDSGMSSHFHSPDIRNFTRNAASVVLDLAISHDNLLGLQSLLGLIIIGDFIGDCEETSSPAVNSAAVLVGMAAGLCQRLDLYSKSMLAEFSPTEARQRSNVFWIAYILDRTTTNRLKFSPFLQDDDVDLDVPSNDLQTQDAANPDGIFLFPGSSGDGNNPVNPTTRFNYFRARVQLAHIEGKIYEGLYSNRSRKLKVDQRQALVSRLDALLSRWEKAIPQALQLDALVTQRDDSQYSSSSVPLSSLSPTMIVHLTHLWHAHFACLVRLHGLFSIHTPWVRSLDGFSATVLASWDTNSGICMKEQCPPLPSAWVRCVEAARGCMRLYEKGMLQSRRQRPKPVTTAPPRSGVMGKGRVVGAGVEGCFNNWLNSSCAFFSGVIILIANIAYYPLRDSVPEDRALASRYIEMMDGLAAGMAGTANIVDARRGAEEGLASPASQQFHQMRGVIGALVKMADIHIEYAQNYPFELPDEVFAALTDSATSNTPGEGSINSSGSVGWSSSDGGGAAEVTAAPLGGEEAIWGEDLDNILNYVDAS